MIKVADILKASILIVDDKEANLTLLDHMLRGAGYVSIASTRHPREVCELHRKNRYSLILLDLQMPGMDGFQVMEDLKSLETDGYLPVLVITAEPGHKLRALKAGAKDFVSKPFELAEVLIRVYNMLEVRLLHLETKKLYDRVAAEQKVSERLLLNVLPHAIAERLKGLPEVTADSFTGVIADNFPEATVLFAAIAGFAKFSESVSAEIVVEVLNDIFTRFDNIADYRGLDESILLHGQIQFGQPERHTEKSAGTRTVIAMGALDERRGQVRKTRGPADASRTNGGVGQRDRLRVGAEHSTR